jgi:hypothetical protein
VPQVKVAVVWVASVDPFAGELLVTQDGTGGITIASGYNLICGTTALGVEVLDHNNMATALQQAS